MNDISNKKKKNDVLVNLFIDKISKSTNSSKNNNDITSINNIINSLLNDNKYELFAFIKSFIDMLYFWKLEIYEDISRKEAHFKNLYRNEFISFFASRCLLNNKKIISDHESVEFLYKNEKNVQIFSQKTRNQIKMQITVKTMIIIIIMKKL